MIWLLVYLGAGFFAGWLFLSIGSRRPGVPMADRALLALPAGLLLIAIATFIANWLVGVRFTRFSVLATGIGLTLVLGAGLKLGIVGWPGLKAGMRLTRNESLLLVAIGCLIGAFSIRMAVVQLSGPVQGWDFYLFHWNFTRTIVETGSLPTNVSPSYFDYGYAYPPLSFLLYAHISVLLGGLSQLGPRLIPMSFAIGTVLVAGRMARGCLNLSMPASLVAGSFALASGYYISGFSAENTDVPNAFFTVAAAYWLFRRDFSPWSRGLGGGLFLGGAYWSRYNGLAALLILPAVLGATALWRHRRRSDWKTDLAVAAGALLTGLVVIAPHLLRNLVLWRNPLYPALGSYLGGYLIDPWVAREVLPFTAPKPFFGLSPDWWHQPWRYFHETGFTMTIALIALVPTIQRLRRGDALPMQLWSAAVLYFVAFLLFMRPPNVGDAERYLLPVVVLVAPLAGLVYEELTAPSWRAVWCAAAIFAALGLLVLGPHQMGHLCAESSCLIWYRTSLVAALLLLVAFAVNQSWRLGRRLGAWSGFEVLLIFIVPFAAIALSTTPTSALAGYVVKNGLLQLPESTVMSGFTGNRKYLSFEDRRDMLGGEPFPGDHPSLERFYRQRLDGEEAVQELKRLGIGYVYWPSLSPMHPLNHPLMNESPLFSEFDDRQLFQLVYLANGPEGRIAIYKLR